MEELRVSTTELRYFNQLDERQRRLYAGMKALELGWNGVSQVSKAYDIDRRTVYRGKQELLDESLQSQTWIRSSMGKKKTEKSS
jgi:hypothetical protein